MAGDFRITGAEDLEKLARRLKDAGNTELRKELLRGIREAGKDTIPKVRDAARAKLPRRGGFAESVARAPIGVRTRASGKSAGVRIARGKGGGNLKAGRLRHPVYGQRKVWREQKVDGDWFDDAIVGDAPQIRRKVLDVMDDIARKIARPL